MLKPWSNVLGRSAICRSRSDLAFRPRNTYAQCGVLQMLRLSAARSLLKSKNYPAKKIWFSALASSRGRWFLTAAPPTPADASVITTTSGPRRTKGLLLFHPGVGAVEKIRGGYTHQNPSEEPRHARSEKQTETQSRGAPGRHAIWA